MGCSNPGCDRAEAPFCCGSCGVLTYCSRLCQRAHWSAHKSDVVVEGCRFCVTADNELTRSPPGVSKCGFTDDQLKIRRYAATSLARSQAASLPEFTRPVYEHYPTRACYEDHKGRPVRVFGVMGTTEPWHVHTVTLGRGVKAFFTAGGTLASTLTPVARWRTESLDLILESRNPGMFLDPFGYEDAILLAEETGYDMLSSGGCACCKGNGTPLPTDRPVLFGAEHVSVMTTRCDECGRSRRGRVCGGCRSVRYCSTECQSAAWPAHKLVCRRA